MELNSLSAERRMPLISDWGWKWKGIWFFFTVDLSTVHLQIPPRFSGLLLLLLSRFSRVRLYATPQTAAHQAPPSLGFSRQEHWSGLPFPSPMHESEKWSRSVVSDSSRSHGLQPTRLLHPWDFPGKSTEVGCHCLLCLRVGGCLKMPSVIDKLQGTESSSSSQHGALLTSCR